MKGRRIGRGALGLTALACVLQAGEYYMFFFWMFRNGFLGPARWYDLLVGIVILTMVPGMHCLWTWDKYGPRTGAGAFRGAFRSLAAFALVVIAGFGLWFGSVWAVRGIRMLFC